MTVASAIDPAAPPMTDSRPVPEGFEPVVDEGFNAYIGPILRDLSKGPGEAGRFVFTPRAQHLNGGGATHGGLLMTLADVVLGFTVHEAIPGQAASTVTLNTDFLAGGKEGEPIEGRAAITRKTKSLVFVAGDLSSGGRILLTASGIWKILGA